MNKCGHKALEHQLIDVLESSGFKKKNRLLLKNYINTLLTRRLHKLRKWIHYFVLVLFQ